MEKIKVRYLTGETVEYDSVEDFKEDYNIWANIDYSKIDTILVTSGPQGEYQFLEVIYLGGASQWYQQLPFSSNYQKLNIR